MNTVHIKSVLTLQLRAFEKPHHLLLLLSVHACVLTDSNLGCRFFLKTSMLVHVSSKKMCL